MNISFYKADSQFYNCSYYYMQYRRHLNYLDDITKAFDGKIDEINITNRKTKVIF